MEPRTYEVLTVTEAGSKQGNLPTQDVAKANRLLRKALLDPKQSIVVLQVVWGSIWYGCSFIRPTGNTQYAAWQRVVHAPRLAR